MHHTPVLLVETVDALLTTTEGALYLDCTFGRGGHSMEILKRLGTSAKLIAIDKDNQAIDSARQLAKDDSRFSCYKMAFRDLDKLKFDLPLMGVLFDLGVSSPQLDTASRGFSFRQDSELDMRMDTDNPYSAYDFVNKASKETIEQALFEFGDERFAKRITRAIIEARPVKSTLALANLVAKAVPTPKNGKHPATKTFQAIRIAVNQELDEFTIALEKAYQALDIGGRIAVITFHSLEDRIFKDFVKRKIHSTLPIYIPIAPEPKLKIIAKKILPTPEEIVANPRARSAHLRVVEKIC